MPRRAPLSSKTTSRKGSSGKGSRRKLPFVAVSAEGGAVARWTTECMTYRIWTPQGSQGWPAS